MKIAIVINDTCACQSKYIHATDIIQSNIFKLGKEVSLVSFAQNIGDFNHIIGNYNCVLLLYNANKQSYFKTTKDLSSTFDIQLESTKPNWVTLQNATLFEEKELEYMGYCLRINSTQIIVLPNDVEYIRKVFESNIKNIINGNDDQHYESVCLKCYGILEDDAKNLISQYCNNLSIRYLSNRLNLTIFIDYNIQQNPNAQLSIAEICSALSKFIYSTDDCSLVDTVNNLLVVQNKKLIIGETITLGNMNSLLLDFGCINIDSSHVFVSLDQMFKFLKVDNRVVNQFGKCSVNTVYELNNLLLQSSNADVAVFILGDKMSEYCYIAIGDIEGIHVYKNKVNYEDVNHIDMIVETSMFYLIKKLRNNNLM